VVVSVKQIGLLSLTGHLPSLANIGMRSQATATMLLNTLPYRGLPRFLGKVNPEILRQIQIFTCQEPRDAARIGSQLDLFHPLQV
jgi:hypothetical protein